MSDIVLVAKHLLEIDKMEEILKKHGIRMSVWACGCCESPDIRFEYNGESIAKTYGVSFDMFNEK